MIIDALFHTSYYLADFSVQRMGVGVKIPPSVFEGLPSSQQGIVQFSFFLRQTGLPVYNFIRNKISKTAQMLKHDNLKSASLDSFFCILFFFDLTISSVFSSDCSAKVFK